MFTANQAGWSTGVVTAAAPKQPLGSKAARAEGTHHENCDAERHDIAEAPMGNLQVPGEGNGGRDRSWSAPGPRNRSRRDRGLPNQLRSQYAHHAKGQA